MSNKTNTKPATNATPSVSVSDLEAKLAAARKAKADADAATAAIATELKAAQAAQEDAVFEKIGELPAQLGVTNIREVYHLVGRYLRKQEEGSPKTGRKFISQETKDKAKQMLLDKKPVSLIATELNISVPTLQNMKSALGLTRQPKTATATA